MSTTAAKAAAQRRGLLQRYLSTPRQKTYGFLGFTLVLVLVFLFGAILPTLSTVSSLYGEIKERRRIDAEMQEKINDLQSLQKDYLSKKDELTFLDVFYPENNDYSLLMASLERIAAKYNFKMKSITIQAIDSQRKSDYSGMTKVEFSLSVVGPKDNLSNFVSHIEFLPGYPSLVSVSYSDSDEIGEVRATISFETYKLNESPLKEDL